MWRFTTLDSFSCIYCRTHISIPNHIPISVQSYIHIQVIFTFKLYSYSSYIHIQVIFTFKLYSYSSYIHIQVIFIFKLYSYSSYIHIQVIFIFKLYSYSSYIHIQVIFIFKLHSYSNYIHIQVIFIFKLYSYSSYINIQVIFIFKLYSHSNYIQIQGHIHIPNSSPTPNVSWSKRGSDFPPKIVVSSELPHELEIRNVEVGDAGTYRCTGSSTYGKAVFVDIELTVEC